VARVRRRGDRGGMIRSTAPRTASLRAARRQRAESLALAQSSAVSRRQLYAAGLTRAEVRANVAARRWQLVGRHVVVVHTGPLAIDTTLWAAQLSGGPRARLDGASSLIAAGLMGFHIDRHRVSVPRGARVFRDRLVDVRQTRRWREDDLVRGAGPPRTRSEVAAVRGALWARSDRQAALLLTMVVQQGIAPADRIGQALLQVKRDRRLTLVMDVVSDLLGGVRSLAELDFARECRRRGLPEPSRQVVRRGRDGRYYLDVIWDEWGIVVEVDGIQHLLAQEVVADALRHNDVTLGNLKVLRVPVLGLRVAADEFFDQIEQALLDAGWAGLDPAA
jgi:very-short-patch-repair endonuclease